METLLHNLSEVFAVSIIHSLWQCLLIYLALRIVLGSAIRLSSAAKYNIGIISLYYVTLWFVYTLFDQAKHYSWKITNAASFTAQPHLPLITTLKHLAQANDRYEVTIEHYLPYITIAYIIGLVFHFLKLTSSWIQLRQLKQSTINCLQLQQTVNRLSESIKLKKQVIIGYAEKIDVPCVAGFIKPLIMLPVSLTTYLSAKEIEAILLHELAHVKRNDYLVNLLQQVMSVIFFFNPFVYLINKMINLERENSCDDIVVELTEEPLIYAQALLKIEQNNVTRLPLALAATGKKYHLLNRIERIMKTKNPTINLRHLVLAFTILLASTISIAWLSPAIANGKLSVKAIRSSLTFTHIDTTHRTRKVEVHTYTGPNHKTITHKKVWVTKNGKNYYSDNFNYGMDDPKLEEFNAEMEKYSSKVDGYYNSAAYNKMQADIEKLGNGVDNYYNNPEYKKLEAELERSGKQVDDYYNNPDYKKMEERMDDLSKKMESYYNNPALKKMEAEQEKLGHDLESAYGDNSEMEKMSRQMDGMGKKIDTYYNSPEFKKLYTELKRKYGIPEKYDYNDDKKDENYKKFEAELNKHTPTEVTEATAQLKKLGEQMRNNYNTPARKAKTEQMRAMGDSMRSAYNNPALKQIKDEMHKLSEQMRAYTNNAQIKQQQANMRKLSEQMRAYTNNPQIKQHQEEMRKLGDQMRAYANNADIKALQYKMKEVGEHIREYTNSPEFKKKAAEWRKSMKFDWGKETPPEIDASAPPSVPKVSSTPALPPTPVKP